MPQNIPFHPIIFFLNGKKLLEKAINQEHYDYDYLFGICFIQIQNEIKF